MLNIYNLLLAGGFGIFILLDTLASARVFPKTAFWKVRGILSAAMYFVLASYSPYLWSEWMSGMQLIDASHLPLWLAIPLGYITLQFCNYAWHRLLHKSDFMWRWFHQMHHSAERVDIYGALYFTPLDAIGFTFSGSFALVVVMGISPLAAALTGLIAGLISLFTHANIKTPRWIGYIIARPEYHSVHHMRGRHNSNFSELTWWDMLFGTFENPRTFNSQVGFYDGASLRIPEMLIGRDVTRPRSNKDVRKDDDQHPRKLESVLTSVFAFLVVIVPMSGWAIALSALV